MGKKRKNRGRNVVHRVSVRRLQDMFRAGDYWGKVARGELYALVHSERHPAVPKANVPVCTRSQMVTYHDGSGKKVALVHQYLQPNGSLGASGWPDPKQLEYEGAIYSCH